MRYTYVYYIYIEVRSWRKNRENIVLFFEPHFYCRAERRRRRRGESLFAPFFYRFDLNLAEFNLHTPPSLSYSIPPSITSFFSRCARVLYIFRLIIFFSRCNFGLKRLFMPQHYLFCFQCIMSISITRNGFSFNRSFSIYMCARRRMSGERYFYI